MQRFIVGTGRCGSTLLCNMLSRHPDALMLSECFSALDRANAFNPGIHTKEQLKALLLSNVPLTDLAVRRGQIAKELLYDAESQTAAVTPAFMYITLPALTDNAEVLFDEMMAVVDTFPDQSMTQHYLQIFHWLTNRFNKTFWFERSGGSIEFMPELYRTFPRAKYLHIHRDGPDAIISMKNHFSFQMVVSFFTNPATREELEQTELAGNAVSIDDPISKRLFTEQPPLEAFAEYWNYQLQTGYSVFTRLDASQYKDVRFEDLIAEPKCVLAEIADFLEFPEVADWIDDAAAMVDSSEISSSIGNLEEGEKNALLKACRPGQILLGRHKHPWIYSTLELIREMSH